MKSRLGKALWVLMCVGMFVGLGYLYHKHIWLLSEPTMEWVTDGVTYELLNPRYLAAVLLAPWFVVVLAWTLADLPWQQKALTVLLRVVFVAIVAGALARPVRSATTDKIATVYLVDVSDSVSAGAIDDARKLVAEAFGLKRKDDLIRVVSFARRPHLLDNVENEDGTESPPKIERHKARTKGVKGPDGKPLRLGAGTNLQAAVQLSYGLFPPGYLRRAVLISDGVQTDGDVLAEANRARDYGVRLHTVPYKRAPPSEVAIVEMKLPERVKLGETFPIKAIVYATRPTKVKARMYQGETLNGLEPIKQLDLKAGPNKVVFKSVVRVAGEVTYAMVLSEIKKDRFKPNNKFSVTIDVPGRPQVLYVEGSPKYAGPLTRALTAQQYDVDVRRPAGFPGSLKELERYDFVIVSDVPKEQLSLDSQRLIELYVRDLGGGFLFAGGENGYGLGGWSRTTIARILPVRMETEKINKIPSIAMCLAIDHSGSMTGLPMEMAKKAAKATVDIMASDDLIEVIAFDSSPTRVVKMQPARNRSRIRGLISRIQSAGGTAIFPAIDACYNTLTVTEARKKHVILLTDGNASSGGIRDLVTAMIAESITVTTVGLGGQVDEQLLKMIADVGGGRFHQVPDPQSLPRIFTKETEMVARAAAVEEWFPVVQTGYANFLKRIDVRSAPYLHGYVATKMKPTPAVELLASGDTDEPILARWRVGTGWSLAWTTDVKTRWAVEWIGWAGWEKFWGQLVREHMRQKHRRELDMRATIEAGVLHASIDAFTTDERFDNKLISKLTILGPQPGGQKQVVTMRQTAPGRYEAHVPLHKYGSFLLRAEHSREQNNGTLKPVAKSSGHVSNPYPREYAAFKTDSVTLERTALATKGQFDPKQLAIAFDPQGETIKYHEELWPRLVMLSVIFFLLDLLLRRVRIFDRRFKRKRKKRAALAAA